MVYIGLYIGRFQPFHNGHKLVVDTMIKENRVNVVLIGVSENDSINGDKNKERENPFSFHTRLCFLSDIYKDIKLSIYPLFDSLSDEKWVQSILDIPIIKDSNNIQIYCGDKENDSAIKAIKKYQRLFIGKNLSFREISRTIVPISGTIIREHLQNMKKEELLEKIPPQVFSRIIKK